jgi:predicted nucleic acid-binding protein
MKRRYGIDTSVLVRLLTGEPEKDYLKTVDALENLIAGEASSCVVASNQVIGEAYIAVQHHYGVPKQAARAALLKHFLILQSVLKTLALFRGAQAVPVVLEQAKVAMAVAAPRFLLE